MLGLRWKGWSNKINWPSLRFMRPVNHENSASPHTTTHAIMLTRIQVLNKEPDLDCKKKLIQPYQQGTLSNFCTAMPLHGFSNTEEALRLCRLTNFCAAVYHNGMPGLCPTVGPAALGHTIRGDKGLATMRIESSGKSLYQTQRYKTCKVSRSLFVLNISFETHDDRSFIRHAWSRPGAQRFLPAQVCDDSVPLHALSWTIGN